jgi:hypothetical protein
MEESEIKKLSELKPAAYNPRTITEKALAGLKYSMQEFGDISGVVFNVKTGNLVGGHQRTKILNSINDGEVTKTPFFDETGTVAQGYIITQEGTRFNYREVDWSEAKEKTANIEANNKHISGDWDTAGLAEVLLSIEEETDFEKLGIDDLMSGLGFNLKDLIEEEEEEESEEPKDGLVREKNSNNKNADPKDYTDENCKMPIVAEFLEHHECFIIVTHNKIDENFVREALGLTENQESSSGDGKVRKANVIDVERLRNLWNK